MAKTLNGRIVSVAMKNTAVVEVVRKTPHPLYKKLLTRSKKYTVDTANTEVNIGDEVVIAETRPLSKNKYFVIREVTKKQEEK